jgi:hypothetical protein
MEHLMENWEDNGFASKEIKRKLVNKKIAGIPLSS